MIGTGMPRRHKRRKKIKGGWPGRRWRRLFWIVLRSSANLTRMSWDPTDIPVSPRLPGYPGSISRAYWTQIVHGLSGFEIPHADSQRDVWIWEPARWQSTGCLDLGTLTLTVSWLSRFGNPCAGTWSILGCPRQSMGLATCPLASQKQSMVTRWSLVIIRHVCTGFPKMVHGFPYEVWW
jgi:hypothetical protein